MVYNPAPKTLLQQWFSRNYQIIVRNNLKEAFNV